MPQPEQVPPRSRPSLLAAVGLAAGILGGATGLWGCTQCESGTVRSGGECVRLCNTQVDCTGTEACVDGQCAPGSGVGGASSGSVNPGSSTTGVASSTGSGPSGASVWMTGSSRPSSGAAGSSSGVPSGGTTQGSTSGVDPSTSAALSTGATSSAGTSAASDGSSGTDVSSSSTTGSPSSSATAGATSNAPPSSSVACTGDTHWDGAACVSNTRQAPCDALPTHGVANGATTITQTWSAGAWSPPTAQSYDTTPSTTACRYTCASNFPWDGTGCNYSAHVTARCGTQRPTSGGVNSDWYWVDSLNMVTDIRTVCGDVSRGINCSDQDGCCAPAGVSINGHCVTYANEGEYCYASPQCLAPLTCNNSQHLCYLP